MNTLTTTTKITRRGKLLGWKVYINGKKYPGKPVVLYTDVDEAMAVRLAYKEAGLDPTVLKDIVWS